VNESTDSKSIWFAIVRFWNIYQCLFSQKDNACAWVCVLMFGENTKWCCIHKSVGDMHQKWTLPRSTLWRISHLLPQTLGLGERKGSAIHIFIALLFAHLCVCFLRTYTLFCKTLFYYLWFLRLLVRLTDHVHHMKKASAYWREEGDHISLQI